MTGLIGLAEQSLQDTTWLLLLGKSIGAATCIRSESFSGTTLASVLKGLLPLSRRVCKNPQKVVPFHKASGIVELAIACTGHALACSTHFQSMPSISSCCSKRGLDTMVPGLVRKMLSTKFRDREVREAFH